MRNLSCKTACAVFLAFAWRAAGAQYCPQTFDSPSAPALPAGWTTMTVGASGWATSTTTPDTGPNAAFAADPPVVTDTVLIAPAATVTAANKSFYFRHLVKLESTFDGGVLEISVDGAAFQDFVAAGGVFTSGGYNATISSSFSSPIAGRSAWSGGATAYATVAATLPASTLGHTVKLQWRLATDSSTSSSGWWIDSIACGDVPVGLVPWSEAAPLPTPALDRSAAAVGSQIYAFGGVLSGAISGVANRFDGTSWSSIAGLSDALEWPTAVSDGVNVYIVGGADSTGTPTAVLRRYNVATNDYTILAPPSTPTWAQGFVRLNGYYYKIGGFTGPSGSTTPTTVVERYDPGLNVWQTAAPLPMAMAYPGAFAYGSYLYVAGGSLVSSGTTAKTYRYDPGSNSWDDLAIADLPGPRWGAAAGRVNGGGMLAGGYENTTISDTVVRWSAASNTWTTVEPLPAPRARATGAVMRGCFYSIGGRTSAGGFGGSTEVYKYDCLFSGEFDPQ